MRISPVENLRFPEEGSSTQGKSGPKPRPKGVGDGQQVEIPVPPKIDIRDGVTQEDRSSPPLVEWVQASREYEEANPLIQFQEVMGSEKQVAKRLIPHCQEKPLSRNKVPVPQTDTGR